MIKGAVKVGHAVLLLEDGGILVVEPDHKRWSDLALGLFPPDIPEDLSSQKRIKEIAIQVSSLLTQVSIEQRALRERIRKLGGGCPIGEIEAVWTSERRKL
jgi:hypothetical protein